MHRANLDPQIVAGEAALADPDDHWQARRRRPEIGHQEKVQLFSVSFAHAAPPGASFEVIDPADVVQVIDIQGCGEIGQFDPRHRAAARLADPRQDRPSLRALASFAHDQAQPVLDQRSQGAALRGSLAPGAVEKVFGKSDSGALGHMSRHIPGAIYVNATMAVGMQTGSTTPSTAASTIPLLS